MVANGIGGANTQTGAIFEIETDLKKNLINAGIDISNLIFCEKHKFPALMEKHGYNMTEIFGKRFLPDEAVIYNNQLIIIEKKYQSTNGSVDEKIQTGPYKKLVFDTCASLLGLEKAYYIYLLKGDAFNKDKYTKHQIPYLIQNGVPVYFDSFPIKEYFN